MLNAFENVINLRRVFWIFPVGRGFNELSGVSFKIADKYLITVDNSLDGLIQKVRPYMYNII